MRRSAGHASAPPIPFVTASMFVFTIQIVTGSLLAMNSVPSPDHAYDSVRFIGEKVLCGSFIRGTGRRSV